MAIAVQLTLHKLSPEHNRNRQLNSRRQQVMRHHSDDMYVLDVLLILSGVGGMFTVCFRVDYGCDELG